MYVSRDDAIRLGAGCLCGTAAMFGRQRITDSPAPRVPVCTPVRKNPYCKAGVKHTQKDRDLYRHSSAQFPRPHIFNLITARRHSAAAAAEILNRVREEVALATRCMPGAAKRSGATPGSVSCVWMDSSCCVYRAP